jgi:hypothetical protein
LKLLSLFRSIRLGKLPKLIRFEFIVEEEDGSDELGKEELGGVVPLGLASILLKPNFAVSLAEEWGSRAALEARTCNDGLNRVGLRCATSKL